MINNTDLLDGFSPPLGFICNTERFQTRSSLTIREIYFSISKTKIIPVFLQVAHWGENKIAKKLREIIKAEKKSQKQISKSAIANIQDNQDALAKEERKKEKEQKQALKEKEKLEKQKQKEAKKAEKENLKNVKIETEYDD